MMTWPGLAVTAGALYGICFAETNCCITPGPAPLLFTAKMPTLLVTILAGEGGPGITVPAKVPVTRMETFPSGALEGMMALICPGPTKTGIAFTVVAPCVIFTETPPSVVESGKLSPGLEAEPSRIPKMVKSDPWAMEPAGKPGAMKLAPLTIPRGAISGWADDTVHTARKATVAMKLRMCTSQTNSEYTKRR